MRMKSPPFRHSVSNLEESGPASRPARLKPLLLQPGLDDLLPVTGVLERAEARYQDFVDGKITAIDGKAARRQQCVVKKIGPGPVTAHYEDRTPFPLRVRMILAALCGGAALSRSSHELNA